MSTLSEKQVRDVARLLVSLVFRQFDILPAYSVGPDNSSLGQGEPAFVSHVWPTELSENALMLSARLHGFDGLRLEVVDPSGQKHLHTAPANSIRIVAAVLTALDAIEEPSVVKP